MTDAAILFDLDGTLVDSAADLHAAAARLLIREGQAPLSADVIRSFVGNGVPKLVERIIGATGLDLVDHDRLTASFLEDYNAHATDLTRAYPGVMDALAVLHARGFSMGICTNKPEAPARHILEALGMAAFFPVVIGGDTYPTRKPDPAGLLAGFDQIGAAARLFVGDSEVDADTSVAADVAFALYTQGYRKSPVAGIPHQAAFDAFDALPEMAERLLSDARWV